MREPTEAELKFIEDHQDNLKEIHDYLFPNVRSQGSDDEGPYNEAPSEQTDGPSLPILNDNELVFHVEVSGLHDGDFEKIGTCVNAEDIIGLTLTNYNSYHLEIRVLDDKSQTHSRNRLLKSEELEMALEILADEENWFTQDSSIEEDDEEESGAV